LVKSSSEGWRAEQRAGGANVSEQKGVSLLGTILNKKKKKRRGGVRGGIRKGQKKHLGKGVGILHNSRWKKLKNHKGKNICIRKGGKEIKGKIFGTKTTHFRFWKKKPGQATARKKSKKDAVSGAAVRWGNYTRALHETWEKRG